MDADVVFHGCYAGVLFGGGPSVLIEGTFFERMFLPFVALPTGLFACFAGTMLFNLVRLNLLVVQMDRPIYDVVVAEKTLRWLNSRPRLHRFLFTVQRTTWTREVEKCLPAH